MSVALLVKPFLGAVPRSSIPVRWRPNLNCDEEDVPNSCVLTRSRLGCKENVALFFTGPGHVVSKEAAAPTLRPAFSFVGLDGNVLAAFGSASPLTLGRVALVVALGKVALSAVLGRVTLGDALAMPLLERVPSSVGSERREREKQIPVLFSSCSLTRARPRARTGSSCKPGPGPLPTHWSAVSGLAAAIAAARTSGSMAGAFRPSGPSLSELEPSSPSAAKIEPSGALRTPPCFCPAWSPTLPPCPLLVRLP
mmetsp:Transcript_138350/g.385901  ORF Transcript_138350/g.385901 Transcript_138350/m.385901 type:complete len:253 (-) Transcript_138350:1476-2234(-)